MVELLLDLDFACCVCNGSVGITVKCAGPGLTERRNVVAACAVKCPHCEEANHVCFEPNGTVRDVAPWSKAHQLLEPSVN